VLWISHPDKVEERTRRKGAKEKGKSRGASLYKYMSTDYHLSLSVVIVA
jgi:hypothetical protein